MQREDSRTKMEADTEGCSHKPGNTRSEEEAGKDSFLEPLEGAWLCGRLDFRFPASRTVRGYISII